MIVVSPVSVMLSVPVFFFAVIFRGLRGIMRLISNSGSAPLNNGIVSIIGALVSNPNHSTGWLISFFNDWNILNMKRSLSGISDSGLITRCMITYLRQDTERRFYPRASLECGARELFSCAYARLHRAIRGDHHG